MNRVEQKRNEVSIWVFVIISILLHIFILLTYPLFKSLLNTHPKSLITKKEEQTKLKFKLVKNEQKPLEEAVREEIASDRNAEASQDNPDLSKPEGNPMADRDNHVISQNQDVKPQQELEEKKPIDRDAYTPSALEFWDQLQTSKQQIQQNEIPETIKESKSSAYKKGGFALNTYDWDFAPYMLALRDKIQANMRPPMSFTRMGIGAGQNIVKFKINRKGELVSVKLLDSETHKTLDDTSMRAVRYSFPHMKLPKDFPEEYLEITGYFNYIIDRGPNARRNRNH